jgi:DNA modification methylase
MMGSGTVLAVARSQGHSAYGVDIDPLAVLISRVWITPTSHENIRKTAVKVLKKAAALADTLALRSAYPSGADSETKKFVRYWFDGNARRQLTSLARYIHVVRDPKVRDALWCAFSRLIIAKQSGASLAMDLSHSRPHKVFATAPIRPLEKFSAMVEKVIDSCIDIRQSGRGKASRAILGDARQLPIPNNSIDLVLTSPPYLNAIDYMRCSKFSLVWMGYGISELREIRSLSVGAEVARKGDLAREDTVKILHQLKLRPKLKPNQQEILARYIHDMHRSVREASRVLRPNGRAVYVIGENVVRGTYIRNSRIIEAVAQLCGLKLYERKVRILPSNRRYLPPPSKQAASQSMNARMRREIVLAFRKPRFR